MGQVLKGTSAIYLKSHGKNFEYICAFLKVNNLGVQEFCDNLLNFTYSFW